MLTETITSVHRPARDIVAVDKPFAKWTISGAWVDDDLYEVTVCIELAPRWKVTSSTRPGRNRSLPLISIPSLEAAGPVAESGKCRIGFSSPLGVRASWLTVRFVQGFRVVSCVSEVCGNIAVTCENEDGAILMIKDDFVLSVLK